ncbi:uncharacterized protein BDW70DRAFT_27459 [Aspergillus foveolatus]|uniref:uncharacterized protein n=1 Tax=Aspergillus foveolatus TaxID=210207 RepID=UPI003CCC9E78
MFQIPRPLCSRLLSFSFPVLFGQVVPTCDGCSDSSLGDTSPDRYIISEVTAFFTLHQFKEKKVGSKLMRQARRVKFSPSFS